MWKALHLLLFIYAMGGSFTLEHPRGEGLQHGKWSIWDSAFVIQLLLSGEIRSWVFLQGPLGQPFAKPTCILAARLPGFGQALYERYDKRWRPTMKLGGKADGAWRTAQAKAYPPKLNQVIAQQHALFAHNLEGSGVADVPSDLQAALEALVFSYDPYMSTAKGLEMCSDYFQRANHRI